MADYTNPIDQALGGGDTQSPAASSSTPQYSNPIDDALKNPIDKALAGGSPNNGQTETPPQHVYQDSSQPWYKRAWDYANTPLTESVFGLPEDRPGAGGFERGVEHIASGLTSPLSVLLTIGTLGTAGPLESAGATALKEAVTETGARLFTDAEIDGITKASKVALDTLKSRPPIEPVVQSALEAGGHDLGLLQKARGVFSPFNRDAELAGEEAQTALSKVGLSRAEREALDEGKLSSEEREAIATKNGGFSNEELSKLAEAGNTVEAAKKGFTPVEDAIKSAGLDFDKWKTAQDLLYDKYGLTEHDLLGGNLLERGTFQILHKVVPDMSVPAAVRASKTAQTLVSAGFTLQQLETAAAMSPRFLDALKEGDYDHAWEYGTEAVASGGLGLLGAPHALHAAGELFKPLIETDKFRPNDEWLAIDRANREREAQHAVAEQHAVNIHKDLLKQLGYDPDKVFGLSKDEKNKLAGELSVARLGVHVGGDAEKAATWEDILREAQNGKQGGTGTPPVLGPVGGNQGGTLDSGENGGILSGLESGGRGGAPSSASEGAEGTRTDTGNADVEKPLPTLQVVQNADEVPRANTTVIHSNQAGEVRVGTDGRPVVWVDPSAWPEFQSALKAGGIAGVSLDSKGAQVLSSRLSDNNPVKELIAEATKASSKGLLTSARRGTKFDVVAEELHHSLQRELSDTGLIKDHLDPLQWQRLNDILPTVQHLELDKDGYSKSPVVRVAETAAKYRSGNIPASVSDEEAANWLKEYRKEVVAKHGESAYEEADKINKVAKQHLEDIENARKQSNTTNRQANEGLVGSGEQGRRGSSRVGQEEPSGVREEPPEGLASREKPVEWDDIKPYLADDIVKHDTPEKQRLLTAAYNALPNDPEYSAAVKAGRAGQLWYERSSRAFDALMDVEGSRLKPSDKDKFLNFVAALSPVQPVRQNLLMALNLWDKWDRAGRPTDVDWNKPSIKNTSLYRILKGRGNAQGVDLPARMNNSIRALQGEPLSGPKVSSFTKNLGTEPNRVTNDTWMAVFGDQDPNRINKPAIYDALSAKIRKAAEGEGINPQQAQAAVWSFIKSLAELSGWGNDRWIPPQEIIKQGLLTPELVAKHSSDFADLLQNDPEIRNQIKKLGGNLDALDENIKKYVPAKPLTGGTQVPADQLLGAANRLETARSNAKTAAHLARKSGPTLFDSEFSPENGLFSRDRENQAPVWYLKSNQLIESRMRGPMPADTVLKMLENNGVKPDELKYTGLSDFLKEKGKAPVRPEEVRSFLAANNLQIQEVTKGVEPTFSKRFLELGALGADRTQAQDREWGDLGDKEGWDPENPTKFGTYTLPGGENYRELSFTLPGFSPELDQFEEPHWGEKAQIGHVRFNDRTGPNGEKLLHLEEMQAYLHQKGRTQGYKSELTPEEEQRRYQVVRERNAAAEERASHRQDQDSTAFNEATSRLETLDRELESLNKKKNGGVPDAPFKKTWPELLFKRMIRYASEHGYDGISWTPGEDQAERYDLSKQISRVHFDDKPSGGIGKPEMEGEPSRGNIYAYDLNGHEVLHKFVEDPAAELPGLIGKEATKKLFESEAKESRDSGVGVRRHELRGLDLKVGGEGMKGFYDKIVPELANKLGKQFGAKVGETKINAGYKINPSQENLLREYDELKNIAQEKEDDWRGVDRYGAERDSAREKMWAAQTKVREFEAANKPFIEEAERAKKVQEKPVPYFPITDSLRDQVLDQGQPLFSKERPNNGLPENLDDMIRTNTFKNQTPEYQKRVIDGLHAWATNNVPDNVKAAYKFLREEEDKNYEIGSANGLLTHYIDDHLRRVWKDANPAGKVVAASAKSGRFATRVSEAQHRVYNSTLEGFLKSPTEMDLDTNTTAQGRAQIIKAAANRQLVHTLRDNFTRASDGRPAVVLSGAGRMVTGPNGENPTTFIDPNRVQQLRVADSVVDHLTKTGDLQRFLDEGSLRDITPYVHPDNIKTAIARLEEQGERKDAQYDEVGNNKLRTDLMYLKSMLNNKDFSGLREFNDNMKKSYAWDPQDYQTINSPAMRDWNFATNDSAGNKILVNSDIRVHPEYAEYLKNRLGLAESSVSNNPIGKALLGTGTKLKETLLSLSPFHAVQEALRGIMVGVNPIGALRDAVRGEGPNILEGERVNPSDPNSPTIIKKATEQGFTPGIDYSSLQKNSEGMSEGLASGGGLLRMIPGIGKPLANSMHWYQDFLFKRYIPALKARGVELMYHRYADAHPDWSTDKIARAAAQHTNSTFGGINWKEMGRSATTQDWGRLMLLAPDWLEAEMSSGARLFNRQEGGLARAQVLKMTLGLWGISRVLNLITTGNAHYEAPFGLAVKNKEGKETVFSIRTLPTDLLHAASDPVGFIKGRLSPTLHTGEELISGRDNYGRKLTPEDLWVDAFRQMTPIPVQSVGQAISSTGPNVGNVGQGWKAIGGTAQTYQTPAQKMAADLASSHSEDGAVDPSQQARHSQVMRLEDQVRAGEIPWSDVVKLTYNTGQIHEAELKKMQQNLQKTKDMDSSMASLYTRASRLPAKEYLNLYDQMNPAEKTALMPLTQQVFKKYTSKSLKEMTPAERAKDPTLQRILNMMHPGAGNVSQVQRPAPVSIPAPIQQEAAYLYKATHQQTGHQIGSNDGQNWYDRNTGEPVNG